jgi:hydroxymethylglutaryl-CoA reductase
MGANAVNTAVERLAPLVESITGGRVHLRILSNLADRRLARASCTIPLAELVLGSTARQKCEMASWQPGRLPPLIRTGLPLTTRAL